MDQGKITKILAVLAAFLPLVYVSHVLDRLGIPVGAEQNQAMFLGVVLALSFLLYPARKKAPGIKWYDWLLSVASLIPNIYIVLFYDLWQEHAGSHITLYETVFFVILIVTLFEALRRAVGLSITLLSLFFTIHPLICDHLPGILFGRGFSLTRLSSILYMPITGIFSIPLNVAATIVVCFLVFGQLLLVSGGGKTIMDLALSKAGRVRGGAAKSAVVASALFGTLSGGAPANVGVTGTFTIPMMKASGYKPEFAGGVEAAASNGGSILPPVMGAVAFIMAEFLGMPYADVCFVAFLPAIIYYVCMFLQVDLEAARTGIQALPSADLPSFRDAVKSGWVHIIPVCILLYFMFVVRYPIEAAALWAGVSIPLITVFGKKTRLNVKKIIDALAASGRVAIIVGLTCAMAGLMMGSLSLTGIAILLSGELVRIAGGQLFPLLFLTGITSFVFGMGMTSIACYIFVVIMVAPALIQLGIEPIAAHLFVLWLALGSFITPPVCIAAYVAAAIAKSPPMRTGVWSLRIGIAIFIIPFVFIYNKGLLLMGSLDQIALAVVATLVGIIGLSAGLEGYLVRKASLWQRAVLLIGGFMMFFPFWAARIVGIIILIMIFFWQWKFQSISVISGSME